MYSLLSSRNKWNAASPSSPRLASYVKFSSDCVSTVVLALATLQSPDQLFVILVKFFIRFLPYVYHYVPRMRILSSISISKQLESKKYFRLFPPEVIRILGSNLQLVLWLASVLCMYPKSRFIRQPNRVPKTICAEAQRDSFDRYHIVIFFTLRWLAIATASAPRILSDENKSRKAESWSLHTVIVTSAACHVIWMSIEVDTWTEFAASLRDLPTIVLWPTLHRSPLIK